MSMDPKLLQRKLAREQKARREAERLLENKSAELYKASQALLAASSDREQYLAILSEFALALTRIESIDELAWYVAREVVGRLGFADCVFYLFDETDNCLVQRAAIAEKNPSGTEILNPMRIPLGSGITGAVALTRKSEIVADVTADDRYVPDIMPGGSEICVPMVHNEQLIGVIDCEDRAKGFFDETHLSTLETIASYASSKVAERLAHDRALSRARDLEEKVEELVRVGKELEDAKEKAEESSALKSRFVATISHEIRTPLAGILGSLDLLQDEPLPDTAEALVEMAQGSGQTLQTLLNDVIDFARSEAGMLQIEPAAFSVRELVESLQSFWLPHMRAKGAALEVDIDSTIQPAYWGDPARIRQVLNNFVSNALKYAPGKIVMSIRDAEIDGHSAVRFSVRDFGAGLSTEDQSQLFTEFTRVGSHKRQIGDGAGLGLAICRQMAELMEGVVGVDSKPGEGSTFWIDLPLETASLPERPTDEKTQNLQDLRQVLGRRPRILVAEDVPTNQMLIRMTLEGFGCRVTVVSNGVEAVEAACQHAFDVIFMDIAMPAMDGTEATARIRADMGEGNAPPVYALTAHGMDSDREEFEAAGMVGIVTKPFNRHDLYDAILKSISLLSENTNEDEGDALPDDYTAHAEFDREHVNSLLQSLDPESQAMLLDQCIADIESGLETLAQAYDDKDVATMGETTHRLKSVGGTFGLTRVQYLASDASDAAKQGRQHACEALVGHLLALLPSGIESLKAIKNTIDQKEEFQ